MVFIRLSCFCSRFFLYSIFLEYFLFFPVIDHNMTHFYLSFESQVLRLDVENNWLWRWKNWEESSRAWSFFSHAREYLKIVNLFMIASRRHEQISFVWYEKILVDKYSYKNHQRHQLDSSWGDTLLKHQKSLNSFYTLFWWRQPNSVLLLMLTAKHYVRKRRLKLSDTWAWTLLTWIFMKIN